MVKALPRRPRGSLMRQQVVEAALAFADSRGLEALTMPALARELECGVMTLYGYVNNKEELLQAMALRGLQDVRLPRPMPHAAGDILSVWGHALHAALIQHPSMPIIFLTQAVIGPGIFAGLEALLGALERAGIPPVIGVRAVYAVVIYVTGYAAWEIPRTIRGSEEEYAAVWRREFAALPPLGFPIVSGVLRELSDLAGADQFEFGLAALVAGLAATA